MTLSDVRAFVIKLDDRYSQRRHWQHLAQLLLEASESGDAGAVTRQLTLALLLDGMLGFAPKDPGAGS